MGDSRRDFLKNGSMAGTVAAVPGTLRAMGLGQGAASANNRVRVGIVGLRGRGENHIRSYGALPAVEIAKGHMAIDNASGYKTFLGQGQEPGPFSALGKEDHFANFVSRVISRKKEELRAPIEEGHLSAGLANLANAYCRLGRTLYFDSVSQMVKGDEEASRLLRDGGRRYRAPYVVPENL
jgi:hypothetical protein